MGESNSLLALANESKHLEITSISPPILCELGESSGDPMEVGSCANTVSEIGESIEKSKSHWTQVQEFDSDNEVAEVSNVEFFQTLQKHPIWGNFFLTFGEGEDSYGRLVMGKKFAEGGQAELYEAQIKWIDSETMELELPQIEWVLKVFKKGTLLRHLQLQWPQGMLQHHADRMHRQKMGLPQKLRYYCGILCTTLLEDGRFAFVMAKEEKDLRSMIDERMLRRSNDKGPFSKTEVENFMYQIAYGMYQLHSQGIVHRDIKASNVLLTRSGGCLVADFECSVGVVGTGFFRAPEILEACKHGNVNEKIELFTKAADVYSYGMACYEILTGKLPFEGHPKTDYDFVLEGQRPKLLEDVDDWIHKLLKRCWHKNPHARPSFGEILKTLAANSTVCRWQEFDIEIREEVLVRLEVALGIRKEFKMEKLRRISNATMLSIMHWMVN